MGGPPRGARAIARLPLVPHPAAPTPKSLPAGNGCAHRGRRWESGDGRWDGDGHRTGAEGSTCSLSGHIHPPRLPCVRRRLIILVVVSIEGNQFTGTIPEDWWGRQPPELAAPFTCACVPTCALCRWLAGAPRAIISTFPTTTPKRWSTCERCAAPAVLPHACPRSAQTACPSSLYVPPAARCSCCSAHPSCSLRSCHPPPPQAPRAQPAHGRPASRLCCGWLVH